MSEGMKQELQMLKDSVIDLRSSVDNLKSESNEIKQSVDTIHTTLFGKNTEPGIIQRIDAVLKVADGIKEILTKILITIFISIGTVVFPHFIKWLATVLSTHTLGG